jgi:50S ribosomal protein L16 3-hydroxylase
MTLAPPRPHLFAAAPFPEGARTTESQEAAFFQHYWGERPAYLPGALPGALPVDGDELAALACEPAVEARLITGAAPKLQLRHGPFADEDLEALSFEYPWTLLVNAVDHWLPGLATVFEAVPFLPPWCIDDLMVSFATAGGSVGAHEDRYHVFLMQLEGVRRWDLAPGPACSEQHETVDGLDLLNPFEPTATLRARPGDVLYLPPGWGHHGVAEGPCLTLSLGIRTPTAAELLEALLDNALERGADPTPLPLLPTFGALPGHPRGASLPLQEALAGPLLDALWGPGAPSRSLAAALTRPPRQAPELDQRRDEPAFHKALDRFHALLPAPGRRWQWCVEADQGWLISDQVALPCALDEAARAPFLRLAPLRADALMSEAQRAFAWRCYEAGLFLFPDE